MQRINSRGQRYQDWDQKSIWIDKEDQERSIEELDIWEVAEAIHATWMIKKEGKRTTWQYSKPLFDALVIRLKGLIEENK